MQCVRCLRESAARVAAAPDGSGAWEVFFCETCSYSWRDNEPDFITDPRQRDPWSQLGKVEDFEKEIPSVPPYKTVKKNPATGV